VKTNTIYVGEGKKHPGLYRQGLFIDQKELHWVRPDLELSEGQQLKVSARIRYRQPLQKATLHRVASGGYLLFETPQSAITQGQFAAWYLQDELVGSGVIA
jgi:tRNA-specific 2-thiouridylase